MYRIHIAALALAATLALCAVAASSAFAADEWLSNGEKITGTPAVETEIELGLTNLEGSGGPVLEEISCSMILQGIISASNVWLVQDVLNLSKSIIAESGEKFLDCKVVANNGSGSACKNGSLVEFWVDHLNLETLLAWPSEIELMTEAPEFLAKFTNEEMGYTIRCELVRGEFFQELCGGVTSAALANVATGVETTFNWTSPTNSQFANCTGLGNGTGGLTGKGVTKLTSGATLSVS
jgi:hypothetical protein